MRTRRRYLASTAALLTLSVALVACGSNSPAKTASAAKTVTITMIGGNSPVDYVEDIAAFDKPVCAPYGINISLTEGSTTADEAGLAHGDVQFSSHATDVVSAENGTTPDAEVIANLGYQVPMSWGGIFAPPGTTTSAQLKGKTLAGLVGGGVPDAITKLLMNSAGLAPGQYSVVNFASDTAYFAASAAGETAATWAQLPLVPQLQKEKWHLLIPLTKKLAYTQDAWLTADKAWASAHPQATEDFLKCWAAATNVARSTDATTLHQAAAAIYRFDDTTINAVLASLRTIGQANGLQPASQTELQQSINFLNGSPAPAAKVAAEINNTYLTKAGIDIPVMNELGTPTS